MRAILVAALALVGCGNDAMDGATECESAIGHYYSSGCAYFVSTGDASVPIPLNRMASFCEASTQQAASSCVRDIELWLECNARSPAVARAITDCECGDLFAAVLWCR